MLCRFRFLLCVFLLLVFHPATVSAAPDMPPAPPLPQTVFGAETVAIMTGATHVETFLIGGDGSDSGNLLERRHYARERYGVTEYREINRYPITLVGPTQGKVFASRLKQALFDLPPYPYNSISCFDPGVGFRVWKERETVEMIVCFHCLHQIVITKNARGHIIHQVDVVNSPLLLTLAAESFPHNEELQALKREAANPLPTPKPRPVIPTNPNEAVSDALIRAARNDDGKAFQAALGSIPDINGPGVNGEIALAYAIENNDLEMVRTLLDKGLSADGAGMWQGRALRRACGFGEQNIARLLIEKGASVRRRDEKGVTAMMSAAGGGSVDIMRLLLDHGAALDDIAADGETLLIKAADGGHLAATQFLLDRGLDVNTRTKEGETALTEAAIRGHSDLVLLLLAKGAAVDAKNNRGETALIEATNSSQTQVMALLLAHGADIQAHDSNGLTALIAAVHNTEHLDCVRLLLDHGADVNAADQGGNTPLILAAGYGNEATPLVRLLLQHGANVQTRNKDGETALLLSGRCVPIMQLLLDNGAAADVADADGDTPLMWAADYDDLPGVQLLLRHHADLHHHDRYGDTALTLARKDNAAKVLPTLIQAAKISAKRS